MYIRSVTDRDYKPRIIDGEIEECLEMIGTILIEGSKMVW